MTTALIALAVATAATAWVSEILVHSLGAFATAVGLSEFFISVVIVAIVGNAAEHGGAIVIARNGKMRLASEIAISSSAQVGAARHSRRDAALPALLASSGARVPLVGAVRDGSCRGGRRGSRVGRPLEPAGGWDPRPRVRGCGRRLLPRGRHVSIV